MAESECGIYLSSYETTTVSYLHYVCNNILIYIGLSPQGPYLWQAARNQKQGHQTARSATVRGPLDQRHIGLG